MQKLFGMDLSIKVMLLKDCTYRDTPGFNIDDAYTKEVIKP